MNGQRGGIRYGLVVEIGVMAGLLVVALGYMPERGMDLHTLYQAGAAWRAGVDPYALDIRFYTPPWSVAVLGPLSMLPWRGAQFAWAFAALLTWALVLRKLGVKPMEAAIFMLNPFFVEGLYLGSYDWLALLGILLPMRWGAWLLALKPQIGLSYMAWWASERGLKEAGRVFVPVAVMLAVAMWLGLYPQPPLGEMDWNRSLGLWGVPVGLQMAALGFILHDGLLGLAAMPFLSPYVAIQSWAVAMLPLTRNRWALIVGVVVAWVVAL